MTFDDARLLAARVRIAKEIAYLPIGDALSQLLEARLAVEAAALRLVDAFTLVDKSADPSYVAGWLDALHCATTGELTDD